MCVQSFPLCLVYTKHSINNGAVVMVIVKMLLAFQLPGGCELFWNQPGSQRAHMSLGQSILETGFPHSTAS